MSTKQSSAVSSPRLRNRVFEVLEGGFETPRARLVNGFIVSLIIVNLVAVVLESDTGLYDVYKPVFWAIEIFSVAIFTVEYLLRIWSWADNPKYAAYGPVGRRLRFIFSPLGLVDLIAIAPFYLALIFAVDLRYLRLLRLMRLLKVSHYFHGLDLFIDVLRSEAKTLASAVLTVIMLIVVIAALMFTFEHDAQPEAFGSILQSIWWSVVTLTTVGYGDVTPITFGGRILAILVMLLGIGLVALPAGILAAKFSEELKARRSKLSERLTVALEDGIIEDWEHEELLKMREKLRLPEEVLDQMLRTRTGASGALVCPSCGHALALQLSAPEEPAADNRD